MIRRLWVVMCCVMILTVGASAQTPEPPPSFENPRLIIENGILTIDDGTGVTVPGVLNDQLTDPIIYEQVISQGKYPLIIGRIDDGTDNFFFASPIYLDKPGREREVGWHIFIIKYPNSRLFDIQLNEDNHIAYLAIIGEDYRTLNSDFPEEYVGKLIVYLQFYGPYALTLPLEIFTAPDGETVYPTLEAFGFTHPIIVDGQKYDALPYDDFATIVTPEGDRITYGNGGFSGDVGLLAWEAVDGRVLEWVEPEEIPFTPAVRVDGEVLPLGLHGGYAWDVSETLITDDGRTVRLLRTRIRLTPWFEAHALYWVELSPLKVVRLAYWNESLIEASLDFLPDASGVLISVYGSFSDGTGGPGVWRLVPGEEPVLLTRDVPDGFSDGGMSVPPRLSVSADGFMLTSVSGETSRRYDLDGTPLD